MAPGNRSNKNKQTKTSTNWKADYLHPATNNENAQMTKTEGKIG